MVTLRDKFYGCIAAPHIGSAMGAVVEGWDYDRIIEKYGVLEDFYPYEHYGCGWVREPGTTEDGIERQKLMITAIMEKNDRVNCEDIRNVWARDIKPGAANRISEGFEGTLLAIAKVGSAIPARDIGKFCDYSGTVTIARSCHPIALINAGDPDGAIHDIYECGQLYHNTMGRGILWACASAAAMAEACKPDATVDSVLGVVYDKCNGGVVAEIDREIKRTRHITEFDELRRIWDPVYSIYGIPYNQSQANEIIAKSFCIFNCVKGNVRDSIIWAVNMGRDTDCAGAVAGGISGALSGSGQIPERWVEQLEKATDLNVITNSRRTMREHADGLYTAFTSRVKKSLMYANMMDIA
jgi:ADP-ribosylglycohydrolase